MIVLDTNVLSELMRSDPSAKVIEWLDQQRSDELFVTAITVAEILHGVMRLPKGKPRELLHKQATALFNEDFRGNILAFDATSGMFYAQILSKSEGKGCQVSMADAQIAAICCQHTAPLATRNIRDFQPFDLNLHNPWVA